MEILNLGSGSDESAKLPARMRLKVAKTAIGIGGLAALTGLGSTLAANISLNNDAGVEFGQGVAQTAACDEDGFTITPVSYYDADLSTFRLDYVEVSGLNLTPMGANFLSDSSAGLVDASNIAAVDAAFDAAIAAHPGQYYDTDTSLWTNTCDQVVLDFKAYTDSMDYVGNTLDGYDALYDGTTLPNTTSSPLMWQVHDMVILSPNINTDTGSDPETFHWWQDNSDIAIIFDATNNIANKGSADANSYLDGIDYSLPSDYVQESSFKFFATYGHHNDPSREDFWRDPAAGAISKITVESMKYFPSDYSIGNSRVNESGPYLGENPN